ncbi:Uncharacterized protein BP5553_01966 [Venustampulla echinocandica]|uniref:BZIP domain-containing protein n=1 Tax=Venustampulla echinocandica TaxID=2656787 RepID=A0A370U2I1_9HELO|nr:Uncharacterized protein BP5553_01966 [Venustampulla echinocandica]RDL41987.1 Uncharacterized protein BP5553_01966 [Venustampulla echinocandica]
MDSAADKEERKREYNRLAQREFRRRRKDHLKNLEQAQREQNSVQSEEIERLRYQNDELRRENEGLRTQLYGHSAPPSHALLAAPINVSGEGRAYSLSPSVSGASLPGTASPPASLASDMMPLSSLSLTSSMLVPSMSAYTDHSAMSSQPYSMVHPSGLRHNSQSSPESSGFRSSGPAMGTHFQSLNISEAQSTQVPRSHHRDHPNLVIAPHDRNTARAEINQIFQPLYSDPSITSNPERHLAVLRSLSSSLPGALKPSKAQLETPHYWGIDMIASPSLRERLLTVTPDVAQSFVTEIGITGTEREGMEQLTIWGDDALNEMSWEFSQGILERWGWLLGRDWVNRANDWRRQRGDPLLPEW